MRRGLLARPAGRPGRFASRARESIPLADALGRLTPASGISPLTQITPENVARLTPLWTFETGLGFGRGAKFEATPIAIDGTL